jgi:hypothetical protein
MFSDRPEMTAMMKERIDPVAYSPASALKDLRTAASAIAAPFDEGKVRRSLEVFDAEMRCCVVQMKATCRAGSGLYYRFFYKGERDLTSLAQSEGMLPAGHSPLVDLQADVLEHCRGATRAGLDFHTGFGLAKVWSFTGGPTPVERVMRLKTMPASVRTREGFFARHRLRHVFFVGADIQNSSMNVYFGLDEDCRNEDWLRGLLAETGDAGVAGGVGGRGDDLLPRPPRPRPLEPVRAERAMRRNARLRGAASAAGSAEALLRPGTDAQCPAAVQHRLVLRAGWLLHQD